MFHEKKHMQSSKIKAVEKIGFFLNVKMIKNLAFFYAADKFKC